MFTEIKIKDLDQEQVTLIEQTSSNINNQDELFLKTETAAGLVFAIAGIVGLVGFVALVWRICSADSHVSTNHCLCSCLVSV